MSNDVLYLRVAQELIASMDHGLLGVGERLPGLRNLGKQKGVSVATAVAAYHYLESQGYIEARPRSGFFVKARAQLEEPAQSQPAAQPTPVTGQAMVMRLVEASADPSIVQLGAALIDPALLPTRAIEQALIQAARHHRVRTSGYEFSPGYAPLRRQLARRMADTGCRIHPDDIIITNGCQEALTLALRVLTKPGDIVALESPTFYGLLQAVEALGLKALEIPTHPRTGLSLDALQLALEQWPVKACVVVPNFSNPLGYCMPDSQKQALVELTSRYQVPLIEDDIYGDLAFDHQRPGSAKQFDRQGQVIYCSSLSKTLSPGLRIGWIVAGRYREQVAHQKFVTSLASATVPQLAVSDLLESGRYERHLRSLRNALSEGVSRMIEAVGKYFPAGTRITRPGGGFVIWVELSADVDSFALSQQALRQGISIAPGPIFSALGKYRNFLRLSCAHPWNGRVEQAVATLGRLIQESLIQESFK